MGITSQTADDINHLLQQLAPDAEPVTEEGLVHMLDSGTLLFVAVDDKRVVGTVLLCHTVGIAGTKYWIEDVVTDAEYRGQGIAGGLLDMAERTCHRLGAKCVNLTSNPAREDARRLYTDRGYEVRNTTVFRKTF